ncbi:hypothetical protein NBRC10512_003453 [Rhodotorula toruloides]|uniref:RHTO0S05e02234g1_1 n=2 Tax=Rhodotorula toruloides TaxID=5286 RepID=A0A061ARS8_RHOTO|nr:uncharacterized protein RHTO_02429 [Rhodotorula toruloides NP11]EMS20813.1 hypothetical protein RHTO_02429 [Rhodotorula toruloides NP11]CDR40358.1 RHTO0S05e02234g1_1 [Rhodotorula toruloides]
MSGGNEHLALPAYTRLDGSHSPHIAPPSAYRDSQRQVGRTAVGWRRLAARPVVFLPCIALALVAGLTWHRAGSAEGRGERGVSGRLQDSFDRLAAGWSKGSFGSSGKQLDLEWVCNPFEANGRLVVDEADPTKNVWVPFDSRCRPSNLMTALYRPPGDTAPIIPPRPTSRQAGRTFLPWLMNRTVVLHGDSIDRFHLKDFCEFVGGRLELITPDHPACPPMWRDPRGDAERKRLEDQWAGRPREGWELTNPWVCDIEEYGATLVNVFTWGLEGAEEFFQTERWYYPPARWMDRLDHITLPLLSGLAKSLDRPQIEHPDLVILNSGYWDLRKYTEEDFVAAGFLSRPYPEDSPIPYTNLSPAREKTWEREARLAIKHTAELFRGKEGKARNGPPILWRTLHHPPRHNYAPFPRVFALDSLARKVISDLRASQDLPSSSSPSYHPSTSSPPLSSFSEPSYSEDLGLSHRLRIDDSGRIMLGQEHRFRDLLHPLPVPGSWVWADVMLYELKRAVEGVDR